MVSYETFIYIQTAKEDFRKKQEWNEGRSVRGFLYMKPEEEVEQRQWSKQGSGLS